MPAFANPSPWRRVDPPEYDFRGVPEPLRRAVQVLNEALEIDKRVVSDLLGDSRLPLDERSIVAFDAHPSIVLGEGQGTAVLSGLGLIQGLVMTPRFRLCGTYEDDNTYTQFYVLEDLRHVPVDEGKVTVPPTSLEILQHVKEDLKR